MGDLGCYCLLTAIVFGAQAPSPPSVPAPVAIVNVTTITMRDSIPRPNQTVVLANGMIVAAGPASDVTIPREARRVDGLGKFLIPGLADMHVHFGRSDSVNRALGLLYVAHGVTTVFNMRGSPEHLRLRERFATGAVIGPTMVTTGPIWNDSTLTFADGERIATDDAAAGYQYIKVYNQLNRAAYWGIISTARRIGIPVVGHVVRGLGPDGLDRCEPTRIVCYCSTCLETTLTSGQANIVHMEEVMYGHFNHHATKNRRNTSELLPEIPALARRVAHSGIWVTPTLEVFLNIPRQLDSLPALMAGDEMQLVPPAMRASWGAGSNPYHRAFRPTDAAAFWEAGDFAKALVKGFQDAGVRLLAGTDVGVPAVVAGPSLHRELRHFVAAGLSPYEALVTATRNPAEFIGDAAHRGTISVGSRADLVLLDANPLEDIGNVGRIAGVAIRGRWLARNELRQMVDSLTASYP